MTREKAKVDLSLSDIFCSHCEESNYIRDIIDGKMVTRCRSCGHTNEKVATFTKRERVILYTNTIKVDLGRSF